VIDGEKKNRYRSGNALKIFSRKGQLFCFSNEPAVQGGRQE
jgi:hypothetical protein